MIVAALAVMLGFAFYNSSQKSAEGADSLTFATIQQEVSDGSAKLYDVRTQQEYDDGHFAGALLHDSQQIEAGNYPDVPKDTKLYVYCRSGNRSGQATMALKQAGFTNVTDLGGLSSVQKLGGALEN